MADYIWGRYPVLEALRSRRRVHRIMVAQGPRDAYILDWHMPRMDGLELLNRLRGLGIEAPIMFLTSLNQPLFEEMALEHGEISEQIIDAAFQVHSFPGSLSVFNPCFISGKD